MASASARLVMSVKVWTKLPSGRWPLRTSITVPLGMVRSQTANFSCSAGAREGGELAALRCLALRVWYSTSSSKRGGLLMNSPGRSSSSPQRPLMIGNLQVLGDQHDALAHVLERELELIRLEARAFLGASWSATRCCS